MAGALVRHVTALDADILCLQEVEADVFGALQAGLEPAGYAGLCEFKGHNKPDGCATFCRSGLFVLQKMMRLEYRDDEKGTGKHSGHVALLLALEHNGRRIGVSNTHLRWDKPGTPRDKQIGYRQAVQLIDACRRFDPPCRDWIVCGDFNRQADSEVVATFYKAGFALAHAGRPHVFSAVANCRARLIDHLFHTPGLVASPIDPPPVSGSDVLPSIDQPSDHLPLAARFGWVEQ